MDVNVEDVGPCKKHLKITVPLTDVQAKLEQSYTRLQSTAMVAGFRKGHVPRKLLERRFGEEVMEEVKESVLSEASQKALEENDLHPIGDPSFDNVDFSPDKDCLFEVTIEVKPNFEVADYKDLKLTKKAARVSDEEVEGGLENLRMRQAHLEVMPQDTPIEPNDIVVCDWQISCDDETVANEEDDEIVVRGRRFGGVELEQDISESTRGAKYGERCDMKGKFSESHPVEKWRGKQAVLAITIKEIRHPVAPELDEEFARGLDFESLDELKEHVRRSMMQAKERETALDLEQRLFDRLLEATPFDLPEGVLKTQARNIMVRQQFRLQQRGVPPEEIEKHLDQLRNASEEAAARNLKVFFILDQVADKEKIFVTENEVENRIGVLANSYRTSANRLRAQFQREGSLSELRTGMREDKIIGFLLKNAQIENET